MKSANFIRQSYKKNFISTVIQLFSISLLISSPGGATVFRVPAGDGDNRDKHNSVSVGHLLFARQWQ
jgi:hypothetical protein